jgi:hypothetical protein
VPQLSKIESSRPVWRDQGRASRRAVRGRAHAARVVVAWSPANPDGAGSFEPTQIELEGSPDALNSTIWTCRQPLESGWVEAISSARSGEVVLTAELDHDLPAKHRVLELAELLTMKLAPSQALIRVRFLPSPKSASRCATARVNRPTPRLKSSANR